MSPRQKKMDAEEAWHDYLGQSETSIATQNAVVALRRLQYADPGQVSVMAASASSAPLKHAFVKRHDLSPTSGNVSLHRLLAGTKQDKEGLSQLVRPLWDHTDLWIRDRRPVCITLQPYAHALEPEAVEGLCKLRERTGIWYRISAASWHFPTHTTLIELWRPDALREGR